MDEGTLMEEHINCIKNMVDKLAAAVGTEIKSEKLVVGSNFTGKSF